MLIYDTLIINNLLTVYSKRRKTGLFYMETYAYIHLKSSTSDLKNVPNARADYILLHEISHKLKRLYIAFLQGVNLPHPPLKIQGST